MYKHDKNRTNPVVVDDFGNDSDMARMRARLEEYDCIL
jgi:hypothetical protein